MQPTNILKFLIESITGYQDHDRSVEISGQKGGWLSAEAEHEATQGVFFCETAQPVQSAINPRKSIELTRVLDAPHPTLQTSTNRNLCE